MQPSATPAADSTTLAGGTAAGWPGGLGSGDAGDGESPAWVRLTMQDGAPSTTNLPR